MPKTIRISTYVSLPLNERIENRADELGLTKSAFMNLAIQAGYEAISLAVNPGMKALFESQIAIEGKNEKKVSRK